MIQTEVRDRLTDEILFGALENGGTVTIGLDGEQLTFTFRAESHKPAQITRHPNPWLTNTRSR